MNLPKHPDQEMLLVTLEAQEQQTLLSLVEASENAHSTLFPEDFLYGASPIEKYKEWIKRVLMPLIEKSGEQGAQLRKAINAIEINNDPELLTSAISILGGWFFPDYKDAFDALSLFVIIRKIVGKDEEDGG